jgi:hypothetical protein
VARCPECNAQLLLSHEGLESLEEGNRAEGEEETVTPRDRAKFAQRLRALENVHLQRSGEAGHNELYSGWGEHDGARFIVLAEFEPSEDGEEISLDNMDELVRLVKVLPAHLLEGLLDVDELAVRPDADWDLIL